MAAASELNNLAAMLYLDAESDLHMVKESIENGTVVRKYQQYYQGIPVWGENIIVRTTEKGMTNFHGRSVVDIANGFQNGFAKSATQNAAAKERIQVI